MWSKLERSRLCLHRSPLQFTSTTPWPAPSRTHNRACVASPTHRRFPPASLARPLAGLARSRPPPSHCPAQRRRARTVVPPPPSHYYTRVCDLGAAPRLARISPQRKRKSAEMEKGKTCGRERRRRKEVSRSWYPASSILTRPSPPSFENPGPDYRARTSTASFPARILEPWLEGASLAAVARGRMPQRRSSPRIDGQPLTTPVAAQRRR